MGDFRRDSRGRDRGRDFGRGNFGDNRNRPRPQMHPAICSSCGKDCEVPFRPTGEKPVFCRDCFAKNNNDNPRQDFRRDSRNDRNSRDFRSESRNFNDKPRPTFNNDQLTAINTKLDQILKLLNNTSVSEPTQHAKEEISDIVTSESQSTEPVAEIETPKKKKRIVKAPIETPTEEI